MRRLPLLALLLASCSSSTADDPPAAAPPAGPLPYAPEASAVVEEGATVKIRREIFTVRGAAAPPNPLTMAATPDELQSVRLVRYRVDADPPRPARAIVVMMPGFLGGAGSFDPLCRALVRRSTADDSLEAWAIDRRSNLLEDHRGLDAAAAQKNPELAHGYYLDDQAVAGQSFPGFLTQNDVPYASEWGLATTLGDLRAVIGLVPAAERKGRVTLLGHSLGASIAEAYAAWDFDGTPGFSELASLVLVDGVGGDEGAEAPARTQELYEKGGDPAPGGVGMSPGLGDIRKAARFQTLPFLGSKVYPVAGVVALRGLLAPTAVVADDARDSFLGTLLGLSPVPRMTNRAALGFAFDAHSNGLSFAAINAGEGTGGPIVAYEGLFGGALVHPSDPAATYGWLEYDQVNPPENSSLDDVARTWSVGPGVDFAEWYFPQRLTADVSVATTLTLAAGDWPAAQYGLLATHGREIDLPIFAHAAGLLGGDLTRFDRLRSLVAPIGPGRPHSGEARTADTAFRSLSSPGFSHIDPLVGADRAGSPIAAWYDGLAGWLRAHSPPGGVAVSSPK